MLGLVSTGRSEDAAACTAQLNRAPRALNSAGDALAEIAEGRAGGGGGGSGLVARKKTRRAAAEAAKASVPQASGGGSGSKDGGSGGGASGGTGSAHGDLIGGCVWLASFLLKTPGTIRALSACLSVCAVRACLSRPL